MSRQGTISRAKRERIQQKQHTRRIQQTHREYRNMRKGKKQSKLGILLIIAALLLVSVVTTVRAYNLHAKADELTVTERQLQTELTNVKQKKTDLEQQQKYMKTKKYIEDEAKDKLGLVYPDEIVIKPRED
ncbi:MAG: septum formation initiator family protein [Eubacterium sp.]|nr:septum formation initiator family protein [Eubacterium sp.]